MSSMEEILTGRVSFVTTPTRLGLILIAFTVVLGAIAGLLVYTSGITHVVEPGVTPYEAYAPYIEAGIKDITTNNTGLVKEDVICLVVSGREDIRAKTEIALRALRTAYRESTKVSTPEKYTIAFVDDVPKIGLVKVGKTIITGAEIEYIGTGDEAAFQQVLNGAVKRIF
jgi:hypothetical protein